jgi:hypothetical protein
MSTPCLAQERVPIDLGAHGVGEPVNQVIVYGEDPCPVFDSGEITVCARKPENERYRIPEPLREIDRPQSEAWTTKVADYERYGDNSMMRCTPTGFYGAAGCLNQFIDRAFRKRANSPQARYEQLIQAERDKRLAKIDAQAAAEQARIDAGEDEHLEGQDSPTPAGN